MQSPWSLYRRKVVNLYNHGFSFENKCGIGLEKPFFDPHIPRGGLL